MRLSIARAFTTNTNAHHSPRRYPPPYRCYLPTSKHQLIIRCPSHMAMSPAPDDSTSVKSDDGRMRMQSAYKHLRCTMDGPDSSYSCLEIHICWKVDREDRMEPPIHTEYLRSGGAMILTFMEEGARAVISFCMRSAMPLYMVVPPDITMLPYSSLRMSTSHFMMEL